VLERSSIREREVVQREVRLREGLTLYTRWGNGPALRRRCLSSRPVGRCSSPDAAPAAGSTAGAGHSRRRRKVPDDQVEVASMASWRPAPELTLTLRGLACSATGTVTVRTP